MSRRILAACSPGEIRVALADGDMLEDYAIWRPGAPDGVGDVHRGRIIARVPAMAGAFVAIAGAEGFLPDSAGAKGRGEGDSLCVRVTRATQGGKGPRLALAEMQDMAGTSPALLRRGPGALERFADGAPAIPVLIDDAYWAAHFRPLLADRLRLVTDAFDDDISGAAEALAYPSVDLPSGGAMHLEPTRALVAIDIDAGSRTAARSGKAAAQMAANREVIPELARQIRLRNLSGAILVDFAGLPARRRVELGPALAAALHGDSLHPRLLGFTELGLAEIVRPRIHPPLHEMLAGPHAAGLAGLRALARAVAADPAHVPALRATPAVVAALQADSVAMQDMARRGGRAVALRADPRLGPTAWVLES